MFRKARVVTMALAVTFFAHAAMGWELNGGLQEWETSPLRPYDVALAADGTPYFTYLDALAPDWPKGRVFALNSADGSTTVYDAPLDWGDVGFQTIDRGPDGRLWVSDYVGSSIAAFDPAADPPFTRYPLPASRFNLPAVPFGIRVESNGTVWFTCWEDPALGSFSLATGTADAWRRFPASLSETLPDPPVDLAFGEDGAVWFTMRSGANRAPGLGRLDPTSESIDTWSYPGALGPYGIQVAGTEVWFLDHQYLHLPVTGALVRFDMRTERFDIYETPAELGDPHWLVLDPDGVIWLTSYTGSRIGTFNPATESFESRTLAGEAPMGIALRPSGEVWWAETAETGEGGAGRVTVSTISPDDLFWLWLEDVLSFRGWPFYQALRDTLPMPWPPLIYAVAATTALLVAGFAVLRIFTSGIRRPR